jgi:hypothetical protein
VLTADKLAACNQSIAAVSATADGEPTVDAGFSTPIQVDRDRVRTTVFPWVAAGGAPGRVAVAFYGATADGDPNSGDFKAAWNVYVNQSVNALDATRTVSQVQATTHPFHYDSICLNGLGCDLAVPPGDRTLASIGPDATTGGFTVTLKVANLSSTALQQALVDTAGQSLLWVWRFANGYQDSAASARWNPVTGFSFGWNDYTLGGAPCATATGTGAASEKCVVFPGNQPLTGKVDQASGTITLTVPRSYLRQLSGADADGRPLEQPAAAGARFYDGTAFSFANNAGATQDNQSFLYTLDNTPAMDFLLP